MIPMEGFQMKKRLKSFVLSAVLVASVVSAASVASAHPVVHLHSYSSYSAYKVALDKQFSIDANQAHDQWELDEQNKRYDADIATATVYYNGLGNGYPRLDLVNYNNYSSYKTELDKLFVYDWNHAFDQWELDRLNAQYEADKAAANIYFGV